jgi:hypothetical protein
MKTFSFFKLHLPILLSLLIISTVNASATNPTGNTNGKTDGQTESTTDGEEAQTADQEPMSPDQAEQHFANTISAEDLRGHLSIIASDEYGGRETGEEGQFMAAKYIAKHFRLLGLPPVVSGGYFQPFELVKDGWGDVFIRSGEQRFDFLDDFYGWPGTNPDLSFSSNDVVFVGYGIDDEKWSDYEGIDVNGKAVVFMVGEPINDGISRITGTKDRSDWSNDWKKKIGAAKDKGAKAIMVISPYVESQMSQSTFVNYLKEPGMELAINQEDDSDPWPNVLYVRPEVAHAVLGIKEKKLDKIQKKINEKGKNQSGNYKADLQIQVKKESTKLRSENILGYLEGTDLKDELIVVSAHYDHIGMNEEDIFNGADDDGSGTVAVLELAEAMVLAAEAGYQPRRSILFLTVSGEEKGLLGSDFYTQQPVFPLENTIADLNIDMIGRVDEDHADDPNYVYIIGSDFLSSELHEISESNAADHSEISLDYTYNSKDDPNKYYYRSDHYNFAKNNIPVIFYFNGSHEDYHGAGDTVDKIEFDILSKRTQLIYHTLWDLANRDQRPVVDKAEE